MPLSDSIYMDRYRRRVNKTEEFQSTDYTLNQGTSRRWGALSLTEETWDRDNHWPEWLRYLKSIKDPEYRKRLRMHDVGGPFYNRKVYVDMGEEYFDLAHSNPTYNRYFGYKGPLVAGIITDSALLGGPLRTRLEPSSELQLDAKGSTAIARCAPAAPHASAYTAIGEIYRDGLPSIPGLLTLPQRGGRQRRSSPGIRKGAKDGSGEYLNFQFGVLPTISDIRSLTTSLIDAERILRQYERDAGRLVRRSYRFPTEEEFVERTVIANTLPLGGSGASNSYLWLKNGETVHTVTRTTETWFSGGFTYAYLTHDNIADRMGDQIRKANHLFGVLPTSEALWNLAPWSWAADWVTNIGDVLTNLSMYQSDGLLMRFGYVMERKIELHEYVHRGSVAKLFGGGTQQVNLRQRIWVETQRRRPATPFGFGLELSGLTGRQQAIMAALAISRV